MKVLKGTFQIGDLIITDITYFVKSVVDDIQNKTCSVEVIFEDERIKHSRSLDGFFYDVIWEDVDIETWVNEQLELFRV